ncbi:MAG: DUF1294 domain-containing protein [Clostridia bacterium]|nr:DUF1294 domain-containing protein [Clostridia bacterium]
MTPEQVLDLLPYLWLGLISLVAVIVTIYDKIAAKHLPNRRTPEKTLFAIAGLGGAVAMYATMQLIRHKTQHKSFMIGIPLIIAAQIALVAVLSILL